MRLVRVGVKRIKPNRQGNNFSFTSTGVAFLSFVKRIKPDRQGNNT